MARRPQVTRTITTTDCNVMCLNVLTGEPFNQIVSVPRTHKDADKLLKKVKEIVDTEEVKAVHIVNSKEVETLYGMPEQDFIKYASILPPREAKTETEENE